jgi:hypothetical protein
MVREWTVPSSVTGQLTVTPKVPVKFMLLQTALCEELLIAIRFADAVPTAAASTIIVPIVVRKSFGLWCTADPFLLARRTAAWPPFVQWLLDD